MTLNEIKINILAKLSPVQQLELIQFLSIRIIDAFLVNNPVEDTDFDSGFHHIPEIVESKAGDDKYTSLDTHLKERDESDDSDMYEPDEYDKGVPWDLGTK